MLASELFEIKGPFDTWDTLIKFYDDFHRKHSSRWLFRGQRDSRWTFETSLERAVIKFCEKRVLNDNEKRAQLERGLKCEHGSGWREVRSLEAGLIRRFQRQAHQYLTSPPEESDWFEWLTVMQHFGTPTRLLDWTYSFFVALYFAVEASEDDCESCAVWGIDKDWLGEKRLREILTKDAWSKLRRDRNARRKDTFDALFCKGRKFVCPINAFRLNERLAVQQGAFLIPGDTGTPFDDNLAATIRGKKNRSHLVRIDVKMSRRNKLLFIQKLHRMNMNRATLFPGLNGFAKSLENLLAFPGMLEPT